MKPITITITRVDTAAYIAALILNVKPDQDGYLESPKKRADKYFPGGSKAVEMLSDKECDFQEDRYQIWAEIENALEKEGIHLDNAPWLESKPPAKIGGYDVKYSSEGIRLGCANVPLEEMKLMIKECEEK